MPVIAVIAMAVLLLAVSAPRAANAEVQCDWQGKNCGECQWVTRKNGDRFCVRDDPLAGKPKPRQQESKPLVPIINTNPWNGSPPPQTAAPAPAPAPAPPPAPSVARPAPAITTYCVVPGRRPFRALGPPSVCRRFGAIPLDQYRGSGRYQRGIYVDQSRRVYRRHCARIAGVTICR